MHIAKHEEATYLIIGGSLRVLLCAKKGIGMECICVDTKQTKMQLDSAIVFGQSPRNSIQPRFKEAEKKGNDRL